MISKITQAAVIALTLALAGCFGPGTPEEQVQAIEKILADKVPLTEKQKTEFTALYAKGKAALAGGKKEEAGAALGKAYDILKYAQDAAVYNKSE